MKTNTTMPNSHLEGKTGRIYAARNGTILVFLLDSGESWFCNTLNPSSVIHKGPVPEYWQHSIDFAGSFSDYFTFGMAYDEEGRLHYPQAKPLTALTPEFIAKLKIRSGKCS